LDGSTPPKESSRDRTAFLHRVARSITEIQANVNNLADVVVFMEVLGYNDRTAVEHGFSDLRELARKVFDHIDFFENLPAGGEELKTPFLPRISSVRRRLLESLGFAFPWLATFALLYAFGFSLWMTWLLPLAVLTSISVGVFFGMLTTEGLMQTFSRLLLFSYGQGNFSEARRVLKRSYYAIGGTLLISTMLLYPVSVVVAVPLQLFAIAALATVAVSVQRVAYLALYTLRKMKEVILSYSGGLIALPAVYFGASSFVQDATTRYLASLAVTFVLLSATASYYSRRVLTQRQEGMNEGTPHFFRSPFVSRKTIRPRFTVQFWETLPSFLFGTFFIAMLFGDRVLSWAFNPTRTFNGVNLPLLFNIPYHAGADTAMFVLLPVGLLQYVILTPIFDQLSNLSLELKVTETRLIDRAVRRRYALLAVVSVAVAASVSYALIFLAPLLMPTLGGSSTSYGILRVAAVSNVFLSLFLANSQFVMSVFNNSKWLAMVALIGAVIVGVGGTLLAPFGFESIVYAYLAASIAVSLLSFVLVTNFLKRPASLFFTRFV